MVGRGLSKADGSWRGRRVLVTGHSGFVGSWLCVALLQLGAEVTGYANDADPVTVARTAWLRRLGLRAVDGDVRDLPAVAAAMSETAADTVVHLAAQPLVGVGHEQPFMTLDTNIRGSMAVLEAARLARPAVLVHVTSDKAYRNRSWVWAYRENDELGGGCPYSVSKAAAELVFEGYVPLFAADPQGPRAASLRFGNVIGGGDVSRNRLVPDCLRSLEAARPLKLRAPTAVRPFQHVLDVVNGMLLVAEGLRDGTLAPGDVFNVAPPDQGASVGRLVAALARAWGTPAAASHVTDETISEEPLLLLDGRKAATLLGWRHLLDLDASAQWTVAWQREVLGTGDPAGATAGSLRRFAELARSTQAGTL